MGQKICSRCVHRLARIYPPFKITVAFISPLIDQAVELLEIMLETWAWNVSRIRSTTEAAGKRLDERHGTIMNTEKEQGMSDSLDSAHLRTSEKFRLPGTDLFGMQLIAYSLCFLSLDVPEIFIAFLLDVVYKQLQEFVQRVRSAVDALRGN